jgi:N-acetylglutamate synthase-like GNAT family acetyltransferase
MQVLAKIATDPNYQSQEAAGILFREMCKAADERQLASYLESSPLTYSLYEAYGFVEVDTIKVDLKLWGGMGDYILRNMVRPAVKLE